MQLAGRLRLCSLPLLLLLCAACVNTVPLPVATETPDIVSQRQVTIENRGQVCFYPLSPWKFQVSVSPEGCFASSCTEVLERTGQMRVDGERQIIQLQARFVVRETIQSNRGCAADCGGAGSLAFETADLAEGAYAVQLGDEVLEPLSGEFQDKVPVPPPLERLGHLFCFQNEQPPPPPTPTYAGPTATPWPTMTPEPTYPPFVSPLSPLPTPTPPPVPTELSPTPEARLPFETIAMGRANVRDLDRLPPMVLVNGRQDMENIPALSDPAIMERVAEVDFDRYFVIVVSLPGQTSYADLLIERIERIAGVLTLHWREWRPSPYYAVTPAPTLAYHIVKVLRDGGDLTRMRGSGQIITPTPPPPAVRRHLDAPATPTLFLPTNPVPPGGQ